MQNPTDTKVPQRGDHVTVRGHEYVVLKVYPFGTMDAQNVATGAAVRITGLSWIGVK